MKTNNRSVVAVAFLLTAMMISMTRGELVPKLEAPPSGPILNISGFAWAENLFFDGMGNLFVSDFLTGTLWRIYLSHYTYEIEPFGTSSSFAGLAEWSGSNDAPSGFPVPTIFAAAGYGTNNATISAFNSSITGEAQATIIAEIPSMGNGLALWAPNNDFSQLTLFSALSYQFVANQSTRKPSSSPQS